MVSFMKVIGLMTKKMVKANINMPKILSMMDNGLMINKMVREK